MADSWGPAGPGSAGPGASRSRRPLIIAGVAVVALGSGAGVALAATSGSGSPASARAVAASPSPSPPRPERPGKAFGRGHVRFGGPGFFRRPAIGDAIGGPGFFGVVHGQVVVPKPGGGYQTVDIQQGTVTAVSGTSITLKSADGFTKTYTVTSSTLVTAQRGGIGSVKVGNKVVVSATQSGAAATATRISDLTLLQQAGQHGKRGFVMPAPSATPSAG
jgi:hypothetical protein